MLIAQVFVENSDLTLFWQWKDDPWYCSCFEVRGEEIKFLHFLYKQLLNVYQNKWIYNNIDNIDEDGAKI